MQLHLVVSDVIGVLVADVHIVVLLELLDILPPLLLRLNALPSLDRERNREPSHQEPEGDHAVEKDAAFSATWLAIYKRIEIVMCLTLE